MYAIIATTEFYGPETKVHVVAFAATAQAAREYADEANHPSGPIYLAHNQAGSTNYAVHKINPARCAHGYADNRMYRGIYLPDALKLSAVGIVEI